MKKKRVSDFDSRYEPDPSGLIQEKAIGRVILVNPMSDERELLEELGIRPDDCIKMDAYWVPVDGDDVHFVQIRGSSYKTEWSTGTYARRENTKSHSINFVSVVPEKAIGSSTVTRVIESLSELIPLVGRARESSFSEVP